MYVTSIARHMNPIRTISAQRNRERERERERERGRKKERKKNSDQTARNLQQDER
jgi:hypothetical protein